MVTLEIGDEVDEESGEITRATDSFTPQTEGIYVSAGITGLETGAEIQGTLRAVEVTTQDGTVVENEEVASTTMAAPAAESTVHFSFTPPTLGWPVGSYVVEIAVDGAAIETVDLTVQ